MPNLSGFFRNSKQGIRQIGTKRQSEKLFGEPLFDYP